MKPIARKATRVTFILAVAIQSLQLSATRAEAQPWLWGEEGPFHDGLIEGESEGHGGGDNPQLHTTSSPGGAAGKTLRPWNVTPAVPGHPTQGPTTGVDASAREEIEIEIAERFASFVSFNWGGIASTLASQAQGSTYVAQVQGPPRSTDPRGVPKVNPRGEPLDATTGEYFIEHVDLEFPSFGVPFRLTRTYRSRIDLDGPLGPSWDHGYNQRLFLLQQLTLDGQPPDERLPTLPDATLSIPPMRKDASCGSTVLLATGHGSTVLFRQIGEAGGALQFRSEAAHLTLEANGPDPENPKSWTLETTSGETRHFDAAGYLVRWVDHNDIGLTLTWTAISGGKRLDSVVDSVGRTIKFSYDASNRLSRVFEESSGLDSVYSYATHGGLETARRGDGRSERYEYDVDPQRTRGEWMPEEQLRPACAAACAVSDSTCSTGGACDDAVTDASEDCLYWATTPFDPQVQTCAEQCDSHCLFGCSEACGGDCATYCNDPAREVQFEEKCEELFLTPNIAGQTIPQQCDQCFYRCWDYAEYVCNETTYVGLNHEACIYNTAMCCAYGGLVCAYGSCNITLDDYPNFDERCDVACENAWKGDGSHVSNCGDANAEAVENGCIATAREGCPSACRSSCATTPTETAPSCADACGQECRQDLCNASTCSELDFVGACTSTCTESCIDEGRALGGTGELHYGHPADLNYNIVRVYDGAEQLFLTNTYGTDISSPNFDAVVSQQFGSYTADIFRRDLVTGDPGVLFPPWVPTPAFETVDICPYTCEPDPWIPPDRFVPWSDLVMVFTRADVPSPVTGFPVNRGPLPAAVAPTLVTFTSGGSGTVTGKIHRRTSATNYLATTSVSLPMTLDAGETVTLQTSTKGNVSVSGSTAAKNQLLQMGTMTLFTVAGRVPRAYPGMPSTILSISSGSCSQPFEAQAVSETEVMMAPSTACTGDVWMTPMAGPYGNVTQSAEFLSRGLAALSTTAFQPSILAPTRDGAVWRTGIEGRWVREAPPSGAGQGYADRSAIANYAQTPMLSPPTTASVDEPLYVFHHVQADFTVTSPPPPPSDRPWLSTDPVISIDITCDPEIPGAPRRGSGPVPSQSTTMRDFHGTTMAFYADDQNNLLRTINHATGSTWSFNYDPIGQLTAVEHPDGARTCMTYDARGNVTRRVRMPSSQQSLPTPQPIVEEFTYRASDSRLLTISDPRTGAVMRTFAWDASGNPQMITEADGTRTSFALVGGTGPERAQIGRVIAPSLSETHFSFDDDTGTLANVIADATGALPVHDEYIHDAAGRLAIHVGSRDFVRTFSFEGPFLARQDWDGDGHHGISTIDTNADGRVSMQLVGNERRTFGYDVIGTYSRVTREAVDSSLPTTSECFDIGPDDRVKETVSAEGIRTRYQHDGMGRVTRVDVGDLGPSPRAWDDACLAHPTGGTHSFTVASATYDTSGRLVSRTDARGHTTTITRDGFGRPIIETRPDGSQVRRGFDKLGAVIWEAVYAANLAPSQYRAPSWSDSGLRAAVDIAYDDRGRAEEIKRWHFNASNAPVGDGFSIERIDHDEVERIVTRRDDADNVWIARYDGAGRVTSEVAPDGTTRTYQYLADGRTIRVSEPGLDTTLTREVVLNAWGAAQTEGVVRAETSHVLATTQFDDFLRPIAVTSSTGATISVTYDAFGRVRDEVSTVPGGNSESISLTYNGDDRVVQRSSVADGAITGKWIWGYDALGRMSAVSDPGNGLSTTSFISGSTFPFQTTDPRGVITTHAWSPLGQPAIITADAATDVQLTYSWDALGRLVAAGRTDQGQPTVSNTFSWDSLGGKIGETDSIVAATNSRTAIFDGRGLPTRTAVGATSWTRTFDTLGRLDRITVGSEPTALAHYTYAGFAVPRTRTVNNAIETRFAYDDLGRRIGQTETKVPTSTVIATWDWEVPLDGVPRRAFLSRPGVPSPNHQHNAIFTVDPTSRLTAEDSSSSASFSLGSTTSYSQADSTANAALGSEAWLYQLDGRSSWISRQQASTTTTFTRDERDALIRVGTQSMTLDARGAITSDGSTAIEYDALGLVSRVTAPGQSRTYKRDALGRIVSETAQGNLVTKYAFDGPTRILRQRPDNSIDITIDGAALDEHVAVINGSTRHFLFQDPLGSVYLTTDLGNNVKEWVNYTAYGEPTFRSPNGLVIASGTTAIAAQYGFQGHSHDFATKFVDMRARMYRPSWGRFVSPDPLGLVDGTNRFAFVGARPLSYVDPFGLIGGAAGVTTGVGGINGGSVNIYDTLDIPLFNVGTLGGHPDLEEMAHDVVEATVHSIDGTIQAIRHPIRTLEALAHAITHPISTAEAIWDNRCVPNCWAMPVSMLLGTATGHAANALTRTQVAQKVARSLAESRRLLGNERGSIEIPIKRLLPTRAQLERGGSSSTFIHNVYLSYVRPGWGERRADPSWTSSTGLGTRRHDDFAVIDGERVGFEANTAHWETMSQDHLSRKLDQVAADRTLMLEGEVDRVVWFGTHPLPNYGLGGQLRQALEQAGITYWYVPWE